MKHKVEKIVDTVENVCLMGAFLSAIAIMLLTNIDVLLRKLSSTGIPGLFNIIEDYLMVALIFLAISYVQKKGGHVRVTLFLNRFPESFFFAVVNKVLELMALTYFLALTVIGWQATMGAVEHNERTSSSLGYSLAPAIFLVCLGCGMTSLRMLLSIIHTRDETG